jgi:hypothetical protein
MSHENVSQYNLIHRKEKLLANDKVLVCIPSDIFNKKKKKSPLKNFKALQ